MATGISYKVIWTMSEWEKLETSELGQKNVEVAIAEPDDKPPDQAGHVLHSQKKTKGRNKKRC